MPLFRHRHTGRTVDAKRIGYHLHLPDGTHHWPGDWEISVQEGDAVRRTSMGNVPFHDRFEPVDEAAFLELHILPAPDTPSSR
ncbi:hypothetical protein ACFL6X_05915 [Candidatus Latescibacterota bacterium]